MVFTANLLCCVRQKTSPLWSFILLLIKLKDWIRSEFLKLILLASFQVIDELLKLSGKFYVS